MSRLSHLGPALVGVVAVSLLALPLAGCGGGKKAEPTVPVKGKLVNTAGKPLPNLVLTFHPQEEVNKGHAGSAVTDKDGRFSTTCVRGRYKITVAAIPKQHAQGNPSGGGVVVPSKDGGGVSLAAIYRDSIQTPLEMTVPEGGKEDVVLTVR
jgi:hypothetical protein